MTFLQPFVLRGLPLILIPVLIHLINRMRHRPQPWAAMRFLLSASRSSVSHQKLRQFLILLFRVLAVLALVMFVSRPLAGGWLGWVLSPAPDVILILLDRSASMETQMPGAPVSLREQAVKLLAQMAEEFDETSHLVVIDSALRAPQEIARAQNLAGLSLASATDASADIPSLFQSAINWLIENRAGTAEIWVASDLQRSNWQPEDPRWKAAQERLASLPQKVRVRLLSIAGTQELNASVSLREVLRRQRLGQAELQMVADLQRNVNPSASVPLHLTLDGARSQTEVMMEGQAFRWRHKTALGAKTGGGWGSLELAADANRRDNIAYFVYGSETVSRAAVVAADAPSARFLRLAATSVANGARQPAELVPASGFTSANWQDKGLLIWHDPLPVDAAADRVRAFVEEGGAAIFFAPGQMDSQRFMGVSWGEVKSTTEVKPFRVGRWEEEEGPLAKTDEGLSLPVSKVIFLRRQIISGAKHVLATFEDGTPFLARQTLGRGELYFCASSPNREWSSLGDGPVLVPMLQRLMQTGSRRLQQQDSAACGDLSAADQARRWTAVDTAAAKDIRTQAGIYRSGDRMLAVNRPAAEDEPGVLEMEETRRLFEGVPFHLFQENRNATEHLQGEFWRVFLFGMLLFLVVEGLLILPRGTVVRREVSAPRRSSVMSASVGG
ncbi:MAG: BatA domain-containing protein [Verrucomicrobia bacterium]|nr:BatA domain-containing protein [Verrucomicrobiota bacterium]